MKRRNFIKLSATASAIGLLPLQASALLKPIIDINSCDFSNRKLILINLSGANDGLNTIIPVDQYDVYSNLRPNIKVPNSGTNAYISLDTTLPSNQLIGLNPALSGFKTLYDQGEMRIIQSVGYPSQNRSHFASKDLYMTGNDGNSLNNGVSSGWIGRFMEIYYNDLLSESFPLAVQIGSLKNSLGFHGLLEHGMSINLTNQDPSGYYSILNGLAGNPPTAFPNSDFGTELEYITSTDALSNLYSQSISNAFNSGTNSGNYPDTDIASQLKTVARLISGDLQSKIYMVKLGGFDTHGNQVSPGESVIGKHHTLLTELSEAIHAFFEDIKSQNLSDDVVGLTYSEFGRKAKENGSNGTDHGEIAPMFVFGKAISGGVSGTNPDLSEANENNNYQIKTVQHDYRSVIGTLLQNFLGADDTTIDASFFNHSLNESFTSSKLDELVETAFNVPENCYSGNALSNSVNLEEEPYWSVFPNQFKSQITINSEINSGFINVTIYTITGKMVYNQSLRFNDSAVKINLSYLSSGTYVLYLSDNLKTESLKIIKQ